ncbi:MAG: VOC family protein [Polyangiales bacterium]
MRERRAQQDGAGRPHCTKGTSAGVCAVAAHRQAESSLMAVDLELLVLRSSNIDAARRFYEALGLRWREERHDGGPTHYSCRLGATLFELYPTRNASAGRIRLGLRVADPERVAEAAVAAGGRRHPDSRLGAATVLRDPDGNDVELLPAGRSDAASSHAMNDVVIVPPDAPRTPGFVRLVVVSDTHNTDIPLALFPPGDLLIHAGDHTRNGLRAELEGAAAWLRSLAAKYTHGVVTIGGNHDRPLDAETWLQAAPHAQPGEAWTHESMAGARGLFDDGLGEGPMRLLHHAARDVAGLTLFGSPYVNLTPRRRALGPDDPMRHEGFNRDEARLAELWRDIPAGLDVLITHGPPLGILDTSVRYGGVPREAPIAIGSAALRDHLRGMRRADRPRVHVFGHEHDARGVVVDEEMGMVFVNAAAVDGDQGVVKRGGGYVVKEGFRPFVVDVRPGGRCGVDRG